MTAPETLDLPPQYDAKTAEPEIYERWVESGVFTAHPERVRSEGGDRDPFVIIMPPPNVTGVLHMGHGLNNTIQDVVIRWRRMRGDEALWVPGTDHAGIATQNVVERQLADEGLSRFDVGREAFVERTKGWVERTGGTILRQLRSIGASADWSRTAYTLDEGPSRAVREAFVSLFEQGLIYKGHRVHHWCPRCLTSLSDEEAESREEMGKLYRIAYPLADHPTRTVTIATTRPETMLADVAVAVNPADGRYRDLVGRHLRLPIVGVQIPVIADEYADPAFGTGAVKITPAHDANDFEVGKRHGLPMPVVIAADARVEEVADAAGRVPPALSGLDRFVARDRIVELLETEGTLVKVEPHRHAVRHCYRCDTVVEPRLSDQWFVRMEPLARPALAAVRDGRLRVLPERWEAVYVNWLENIRDWNISRQLWWGHRIPVWYCDECDPPQDVIASRTDLAACPHCGCPVRRDEDVLDTWFSSWLWPFSTLGWPGRTTDLRAFYPSDVLVTAPEILFFWVARMVMAGYRFMGDAPFHTVYLTGTARDAQHQRMSKSRGNGIDPLDVVGLYGADALRYTVVAGMGMGTDLVLDHRDLERSFAPGRNFATKLWNIGRFLLANVGREPVQSLEELPSDRLQLADRWILGRLDAAVADCDAALGPSRPAGPRTGPTGRWPEPLRNAGLRLDEYADAARRFVWNELADWYLEAVKGRLAAPGDDREVARAVLVHAFDAALRVLHPIVPFITETLWQRLPGRGEGELLCVAAWPRPRAAGPTGAGFELVRSAVGALRQVRADYGIPPGTMVEAAVVPADASARRVFDAEAAVIGRLARAGIRVADAAPRGAAAHALLPGGSELVVPLAGVIDLEKECRKLRAELEQLVRQLGGLEARLRNESFLSRAKPEVVAAERSRRDEWTARREQLARKVEALCGG
ncbi:MAG TPA: valine--tRNA ligase [Gemmatimonadaceae bacterium]|nr:valine--tRNA ligase [Gemmatimonadaceae bacterium]